MVYIPGASAETNRQASTPHVPASRPQDGHDEDRMPADEGADGTTDIPSYPEPTGLGLPPAPDLVANSPNPFNQPLPETLPNGSILPAPTLSQVIPDKTPEQIQVQVNKDRESYVKANKDPSIVWRFISAFGGKIGEAFNQMMNGTPEERKEAMTKAYDQALSDAGGNPDVARVILAKGLSPSEALKVVASGGTYSGDADAKYAPITSDQSKQAQRGSIQDGGVQQQLTPQQATQATIDKAAADREAELAKQRQAEAARVQGLVQGYNQKADMSRYQGVDPTLADNPLLAEAMKRYNDLMGTTAESEANVAKATQALQDAVTLNAGNRNAWAQYYNPEDYRAQAVQAQAAQGQAVGVAPAQTLTGNYQADLSRLSDYNPEIARSDVRNQSLEAMNMARDTALGLKPSVAENQYRQDLDKLAASQAAAVAGQRGQGSALAQEALARQTAEMGQKAVRETAGLRLQEQQAAEQAYAAQAQGLMIEDQKLNVQQKTNELQQAMQLTQANLDNAKQQLAADSFNAEAVNRVNQLSAQYQNQMAQLNTQLQNSTNLANMEQQNNTSLQNAMRNLEAAKYAGASAQSALQAQIGLERADIGTQYGWNKDLTTQRADTTGTLANAMASMGTNQEVAKQNAAQLEAAAQRWGISRADALAAQEEAKRLGITRSLLALGGPAAVVGAAVAEKFGLPVKALEEFLGL